MTTDATPPSKLGSSFLNRFCKQSLLDSPTYSIDKFTAEIKIDQNEMPWDWPKKHKEAVAANLVGAAWNRYPDAHSIELNAKLADHLGVAENSLLTSSGSDSILTMLLRGFGNTKIIGLDPSFPVTKIQAGVHDLRFAAWPLDENFQFDLDKIPEIEPGSLVIFASPNNPTGSVLELSALKRLLSSHPDSLFIADEAYAEFHDQDAKALLAQFPNLLSLRTLSKAWASAGLRFGYALGDPAIIAELKKFRLPYAVNAFSSCAVEYFTQNKEIQTWSQSKVSSVKSLIKTFSGETAAIGTAAGWKVHPTAANFFLLSVAETTEVPLLYNHLKTHGILVRNVSQGKGLERCLRFSCGSPEQIDKALLALKAYVG